MVNAGVNPLPPSPVMTVAMPGVELIRSLDAVVDRPQFRQIGRGGDARV